MILSWPKLSATSTGLKLFKNERDDHFVCVHEMVNDERERSVIELLLIPSLFGFAIVLNIVTSEFDGEE